MKLKVVYIIIFLGLVSTYIEAQKPSFDLLPIGRSQKIPEAIVDIKYYNDSTFITPELNKDSFQIKEHKPLITEIKGKLLFLIFISRLEITVSTLYRSFVHI